MASAGGGSPLLASADANTETGETAARRDTRILRREAASPRGRRTWRATGSAPAPIAASDAATVWRRLTGAPAQLPGVRCPPPCASRGSRRQPQTAANGDRIPPARHAL
jgi:hypothetical protein